MHTRNPLEHFEIFLKKKREEVHSTLVDSREKNQQTAGKFSFSEPRLRWKRTMFLYKSPRSKVNEYINIFHEKGNTLWNVPQSNQNS